MTIPNLPTDNLYKFIALSGLTIILTAVYLYATRATELRNEVDLVKSDLEMIDLELSFIEADLGIDKSLIDSIKVDTTKLDKAEKKRLIELSREIKRKIKLIEIKATNLDDKNINLLKLGITLLGLFTLGLFMSIFGFKQWYYKIQKPIDDKILLESKNMKPEKKKRNKTGHEKKD